TRMRMGATEDAASRRPQPTLDMDAHRESGSVGGGQRAPRPVLVLGLPPAALWFARSPGRAGIPVHGGVFRGHEFGLRSRYLRSRCVAVDALEEERDRRMLAFLRTLSAGERTILVSERDEDVAVET